MQTEALKELVIDTLEEMKAQKIVVLDVEDISSITDIMIIASGTSNRQVKSIADRVVEKAKQNNCPVLGVEGADAAEWVLVDLGDVVVHVMQNKVREFYQLERLWSSDDMDQTLPQQSAGNG